MLRMPFESERWQIPEAAVPCRNYVAAAAVSNRGRPGLDGLADWACTGAKLAAWLRRSRSVGCAKDPAFWSFVRKSAPSRIRTYAHGSGGRLWRRPVFAADLDER